MTEDTLTFENLIKIYESMLAIQESDQSEAFKNYFKEVESRVLEFYKINTEYSNFIHSFNMSFCDTHESPVGKIGGIISFTKKKALKLFDPEKIVINAVRDLQKYTTNKRFNHPITIQEFANRFTCYKSNQICKHNCNGLCRNS